MQIDLIQLSDNLPEEVSVIVTFLELKAIDLQAHSIDEAQAAELQAQLATFTDWR
ncbi:MAG: hypothetical protein JOZ57_01290, partial [Abitibacteriaceae bacterium]|nr:hypothetical protein [Abditibacteriaceae bacterium]